MLSLLPIVGERITWDDLIEEAIGEGDPLRSLFKPWKHVYFVGSGAAAWWVVLRALQKATARKNVILPAYSASCLVATVRQLGLKPVLCDMEPDGFNMDARLLASLVDKDTLAVLGVHLFGLPMRDVRTLRSQLPPSVFFVEDCAQAMGSRAAGRQLGTFGDAGFFSFNRGKNLPLSAGGCLVTDNDSLALDAEKIIASLKPARFLQGLSVFAKMVVLKAAMNPYLYRAIYAAMRRRKERPSGKVRLRFTACPPTVLRIGDQMAKRFAGSAALRARHGRLLLDGLKDRSQLVVPSLGPSEEPVFNRFPLIFRDLNHKRLVQRELSRAGIESSSFYVKPLHRFFDLGYKKGDFPQATYLAKHLLTLPTHPLVTDRHIEIMIDIIKRSLRT
jgi:dTDP-4-amino-4,6-dideoxygalactose transaminase